jgi:hypothetical protein
VRVLLPVTGCPGQQQEEKTGSGPLWLASGAPFTVYAGASCKAVGFSDAEGLARRRLALGEQHAVERHVWQHDLAVPRAVDVTGGGAAVPLAVGLGRLEAALADSYGGVGVVHAPRALAPLMAEARQISQVRSQLRTVLGTPVAFGGGYLATGPSGAAAAAGTAWLYASGVVTIRRSEVFVPVMPTTGGFDTRTNDVLVIAERTFVVPRDCALFAVQVDVGGTE